VKVGNGYEPGAMFEGGRQASGYRGVADVVGARGRAAFRVAGCGAVDPVLAEVGPVQRQELPCGRGRDRAPRRSSYGAWTDRKPH
jgi:hypothetical protein